MDSGREGGWSEGVKRNLRVEGSRDGRGWSEEGWREEVACCVERYMEQGGWGGQMRNARVVGLIGDGWFELAGCS